MYTKEQIEKARKVIAWVTGAEGGKARAIVLSKERRSEIARKAANARWGKHRKRKEVTK